MPSEEIRIIFQKMAKTLKPKGIIFIRKYAHSIMETPGRIFYNMTKKMVEKEIAGFVKIIEMWTAQGGFNCEVEHPDWMRRR